MSDAQPTGAEGRLSAIHVLEYPYTRSVGPVIGRFLTGLRDGRIEGTRTAAGRVLVPPSEYDPETAATLDEFVEVADCGEVSTWTWVAKPRAQHKLDRPFAFALIQLDGADTSLLHMVDCGDASRMRKGLRVRANWRDEREGAIGDIVCFVPEEDGA